MRKNQHLYLGKAGHLAVMSEFLVRGWNVAIPEVDVGDDIFVVQDDNGTLRRVQVKTSASTVRRNSFSGQFNVSLKQLRSISNILIHYAFIVRHNNLWTMPLIIRQDYLLESFQNNHMGTPHGANLKLYFSYLADGTVDCSGIDLSEYVADFTDFPY